MKVGFVGLGEVGGKLAGSLARHGVDLTVCDLDRSAADPILADGAMWSDTPQAMAPGLDVLITCLPSPAATRSVMEGPDGALAHLKPGAVWLEMSTTDADEVRRIAGVAAERAIKVMDCPVSGGCHRAATGNIAIFAAGDRATFEQVLPLLTLMGRQILHTGDLGSASTLKVMTNVLATAHLAVLAEAMVVMSRAGMDMATTYEAIRISSGNSFVHETEGQVILNGSRDVGFTNELVLKDIRLFQDIADKTETPLDINPLLIRLFEDACERFGGGAWSTDIIRRLEEATGTTVHAPGFPAELVDTEPEARGVEIKPKIGRTAQAAE
ncbi:MAG: NAD(P)-dependent oxidoreductase [Pseudomonadota bacterium]